MKTPNAVRALAALAQPSRLAVFRLLARHGAAGLAAGAIATRLRVPPSTLSFHLSQLERAGLIEARRERQSILYALSPRQVRGLLEYLTEDCCGGRPDLCAPRARVAADDAHACC